MALAVRKLRKDIIRCATLWLVLLLPSRELLRWAMDGFFLSNIQSENAINAINHHGIGTFVGRTISGSFQCATQFCDTTNT